MKISEKNKKGLVKEIIFVIEKIENSFDIEESLFYLSAIHSQINRIYNMEFDRHLVFMHYTLINCYNTILQAITMMKQRKNPIIIDEKFIPKLVESLNELAKSIEEGKPTHDALEKIVVVVYSITGNGFYLQQKGINVIDF